MDLLTVDVLPPDHDGDDDDDNDDDTRVTHPLLRLPSHGLQPPSADDAPTPPPCHRPGPRRRRKISKGIQLILLRKYVHWSQQYNRIPDRSTTEQLLDQGYDEYYYQGGNFNEPRLSYTAFLKLVRNRRSEVVRRTRGNSKLHRPRGLTGRCHKEQMEIRALIDELEHVRHAQSRSSVLDCDALSTTSGSEHSRAVMTDASVPILSDSSSMMGDTGPDSRGSAEDLTTTETYSSVMAGTNGKRDDVIVSRSKLDLMLRVAQETLMAQKKILEEVRAMEQRIAGIH